MENVDVKMKITILLTRVFGPVLIGLATLASHLMLSKGVDFGLIFIALASWSYAVGYIDRGWTQHLRDSGLISQ